MHSTADAVENVKALTFELNNRSNSEWVKKGTERYPNPVHLNAPKRFILPLRSMFCLGKGKGYAKIQYVEGAPTIFIDDVWVDKSGNYLSAIEASKGNPLDKGYTLARGLLTLKYDLDHEYRNVVRKDIHFAFGILHLDKYGNDPTLLEFVKHHELNKEAPNAEHNTRPIYTMWKFHCVQEEKKAEVKLEFLDEKAEALMLIASLRTKTKDSGYLFGDNNVKKMDAMLTILGIEGDFDSTDHNRKLLALNGFAEGQPAIFMDLIGGEYNDKRSYISTGIEKGILEFVNEKKVAIVKLVVGEKGGLPEKRTILTCTSQDQEGQIEELSTLFLTREGATQWRDFILLLEAKK